MNLQTFNELESEVRSYVRSFPTVFEKARGHILFDEEGNEYLDFFAGAGALNYGHNHPLLKEKLLEYIENDGVTHALDMATTAKRSFLQRLEEVVLLPRKLDYKVMFPGPTGTNAVEAALKLARKVTGRRTVYAFDGGFHGMTLGALAITSNKMKRAGAGVPLPDARLLPFDGSERDGRSSLELLEASLREDAARDASPAAIVLETVQCEGGVNVATSDWLRAVARLAEEFGVLLVVDDIQAGCGRTGSFFSFEEAGIVPDIVCLSKSLSGIGLPLAIVLFKRELDCFSPGEHNGTFRGNNPAFVSATAALDFWSDDALGQEVDQKAERIRERLGGWIDGETESPVEVRGRGLVQGLVFETPGLAKEIAGACFERGLLIETAGHVDEVLKLLPSLTIPLAALDKGLTIIEQSLAAVRARRLAEAVATA